MINKEYKEYLLSKEWKNKRIELFNARGKHCERCKSTLKLEIHHKTYKNIFNEPLSDLEILCKICHMKEHNLGIKSNNLIKQKHKKKSKKKKISKAEKKKIRIRNKMNSSRNEQLKYKNGLI